MSKIRIRLIALMLASVVVTGCGESAPPQPVPHQGGDGGKARPHEAPTKAEKKAAAKSAPRLDE